jgi:hypothetical protein
MSNRAIIQENTRAMVKYLLSGNKISSSYSFLLLFTVQHIEGRVRNKPALAARAPLFREIVTF